MDETRQNEGRGLRIASWLLGILLAGVMIVSGVMKFIRPPGFDDGIAHLGWDADKIFFVGVVEILIAVIYLIPRTAVLGAILLTAYMGGAIATHVRVGDPFYAQILIGVLFWFALYLRDPKIRDLIPFHR